MWYFGNRFVIGTIFIEENNLFKYEDEKSHNIPLSILKLIHNYHFASIYFSYPFIIRVKCKLGKERLLLLSHNAPDKVRYQSLIVQLQVLYITPFFSCSITTLRCYVLFPHSFLFINVFRWADEGLTLSIVLIDLHHFLIEYHVLFNVWWA